jgi:hypothetical protein
MFEPGSPAVRRRGRWAESRPAPPEGGYGSGPGTLAGVRTG